MALRAWGMLTGARIIEEEFDQLASNYEDNRLAPWYQAQGEAILDVLDLSHAPVVLDIGCGTGWLLRRIVERSSQATGIGLDLSGEMIKVAREKSLESRYKSLSFIQSDWEDMECETLEMIAGRNLTHVIVASTFHYFSDPLTAVKRIFQVLQPGGRLVVMERARDDSILTSVWDVLHGVLIKDNVQFFYAEELKRLLDNAGFADVEVVWRMNRLFWKNKLYTSLVLLSAAK